MNAKRNNLCARTYLINFLFEASITRQLCLCSLCVWCCWNKLKMNWSQRAVTTKLTARKKSLHKLSSRWWIMNAMAECAGKTMALQWTVFELDFIIVMDGDWAELSALSKAKNHIFHSTSFLEFNCIVFSLQARTSKTMKMERKFIFWIGDRGFQKRSYNLVLCLRFIWEAKDERCKSLHCKLHS